MLDCRRGHRRRQRLMAAGRASGCSSVTTGVASRTSRGWRARASLGIVRLIDAYGGRDELGEPRWWTWGEVRSYYVVQCAEPLPSWLRQVQLEYSRLLRELDGQREASQWLTWYDRLAAGQTPDEAPGVATRLAAMRRGWPMTEILDVKESGLVGDNDPDYLVHWHTLSAMERTWEGTKSVLHHWKVHEE